ncbi:hypothetical protein ES288_D12G186200v1 [Gossypium darwinii]|uniref:Bifunctional inhibitor/plant lipid transfer protein/seed storage helical domain-containing protein n=1 Tax=Gossypium darwinii TaxID=34276 RepID=A0A5D2A9J8_GOSDA|nr:hypothetical protein ES288_D12G186200v1 [Gossypium darwinii]
MSKTWIGCCVFATLLLCSSGRQDSRVIEKSLCFSSGRDPLFRLNRDLLSQSVKAFLVRGTKTETLDGRISHLNIHSFHYQSKAPRILFMQINLLFSYRIYRIPHLTMYVKLYPKTMAKLTLLAASLLLTLSIVNVVAVSSSRKGLRGCENFLTESCRRLCCGELERIEVQRRCSVIRRLVKELLEDFRSKQKREMLQKARNLPALCRMGIGHCDIRVPFPPSWFTKFAYVFG